MSTFCDITTIEIKAGRGGSGSSHFHREKYVSHGGPDGGNGGKGGDIIFEANENINTLIDFHTKKNYTSEEGGRGGKSLMHGADGEDLLLRIPVGTMVFDNKTNKLLYDFKENNQKGTVAFGGRGGLGNAHFKSSINQAPTLCEKGEPGETWSLRLELKLVADMGIIGLPSVGKSTLISRISNARPKIADYPFTTLIPNLGMVDMRVFDKDFDYSFVVTDIPGLIEGAHEGKGLGHEFLRHISRNHILLHLLDATRDDICEDYEIINNELASYSEDLAKKEQIVTINKIDAIQDVELAEKKKKLLKKFPKLKNKIHEISSVSGEGLRSLMLNVAEKVREIKSIEHEIQAENEDKVILNPETTYSKFTVRFVRKKDLATGKTQRVFEITGKRIEQLIAMTDLENYEGKQRIYHFLNRMGIKKELIKLGAIHGDRLRIGDENILFKP